MTPCTYFGLSLAWSALGLVVGLVLGIPIGYLLRLGREHHMFKIEKFRERATRQLVFGIVLLLLAVLSLIQGYRTQRCLNDSIAVSSVTSKLRSGLVEKESEATRAIVRGAFTATSRQEALDAFAAYRKALDEIDQARKENPVEEFQGCGGWFQ